jgi:hypothetical protein
VHNRSSERFSYCAGLSQVQAWLVALLLALTLLFSLVSLPKEGPPSPATPAAAGPQTGSAAEEKDDDIVLYETIIARVASGVDYYTAAAQEQRVQNYPLRPFITFRLPTLAVISAYAGPAVMTGLMWLLMAGTIFAWKGRMRSESCERRLPLRAMVLVAASSLLGLHSKYLVVHEVWAGLLIAASLAVHRSVRWWPSVLIGAAALMIRELALPFIFLMAAFALVERRWKESAAWVAVIGSFILVMALHAHQVGLVTSIADPASPGWASSGGWQNFLMMMRLTGALRIFPDAAATIIAVLALFGWVTRRSDTGHRGALLFLGYSLIFMTFGRENNFYWGLLVAPAFLAGLAFCPAAFAELLHSLRARQGKLDSLPA